MGSLYKMRPLLYSKIVEGEGYLTSIEQYLTVDNEPTSGQKPLRGAAMLLLVVQDFLPVV